MFVLHTPQLWAKAKSCLGRSRAGPTGDSPSTRTCLVMGMASAAPRAPGQHQGICSAQLPTRSPCCHKIPRLHTSEGKSAWATSALRMLQGSTGNYLPCPGSAAPFLWGEEKNNPPTQEPSEILFSIYPAAGPTSKFPSPVRASSRGTQSSEVGVCSPALNSTSAPAGWIYPALPWG